MRRRDHETRERLASSGELFDGYHPEMERVHRAHAARLASILDTGGWPGQAVAGEDGAEAAWIVAQHAISEPAFQRRCLEELRRAVDRGDAPPRHLAHLADRIRYNERRPQRYGTIFDWDARNRLSPWTIESPEKVEERRNAAGLPPLEETIARVRADAAAQGHEPPGDYASRRREIEAWARKVGWI